jgi:hypothetical protein
MAGAARRMTPETYDPWPLDLRLLELMPDEGLIGGVHHAGRTIKGMVKQINDEVQQNVVTTSQAQPRARILREVGYADHKPASGGRVWARTPAGKKFLAEARLAQEPKDEHDTATMGAHFDYPVEDCAKCEAEKVEQKAPVIPIGGVTQNDSQETTDVAS